MKRLDEIFEVWYGVNLEVVNSEVVEKDVPFVSRQSVNNGVVCHVKRMPDVEPNPANTLSIAVSGSVLSTFYHDYEYYSGRDVYIAKPKISLTKAEMLYYCYVIQKNKYRYNYGRGANKTFRSILVPSPDEIPIAIKQKKIECNFKVQPLSNVKKELDIDKWKWFRVGDLFDLEKCKCSNATELLEDGNEIAYIGAKKGDNGIMDYVRRNEVLVSKGNCVVFIGDGQGSVGYCTYQPEDFIGSTTLIAGYNSKLNAINAQFLIAILDQERYRYSFGRKYNKTAVQLSRIKLPAIQNAVGEYEPDWQWMEDYIKGLPYSGCLK